jgi:poly-gamma-glutamate synthesis protein (capsule biosynthesis protein)
MRLALTGDSMITRRLPRDGDPATRQLFDLIAGADAAFTNIELVPNGFRGHPTAQNGGTHIAAEPFVLDELLDMGFRLFSAGNNHSLDYGIAGLLATMEELERRGMVYAGIGRTLEAARHPVYLDSAAGSIALLACCTSFAPGQEAGVQRPDAQGRPGITPLRFTTTYEVTPDQLASLRAVAEQLGLERQRLDAIQLGFGFAAEPDIQPFLGASFRAAAAPAIRTTAHAPDVEAMARWVGDARSRADIVMVSLHTHEQGATPEDPPDFVPPFCRRMIDAGADLVVGHGPHLLRGMEFHRGRPIFYSLGNFIAQNELVARLPADSYDKFRIPQDQTPAALYRQRSDDGRRGFPAEARYWESVLPICRFSDGALADITIHPVTLGHGQPTHRRGRPRLAEGVEGAAILRRFARLSNLPPPDGPVLHVQA